MERDLVYLSVLFVGFQSIFQLLMGKNRPVNSNAFGERFFPPLSVPVLSVHSASSAPKF